MDVSFCLYSTIVFVIECLIKLKKCNNEDLLRFDVKYIKSTGLINNQFTETHPSV